GALLPPHTAPRSPPLTGLFCFGQIIAWGLFVTVKVPGFSETPEPVEGIALVAKAAELIGVVLALHLVLKRRRSAARLAELRSGVFSPSLAKKQPRGFRAVRGGLFLALAATASLGLVAVALANGAPGMRNGQHVHSRASLDRHVADAGCNHAKHAIPSPTHGACLGADRTLASSSSEVARDTMQ